MHELQISTLPHTIDQFEKTQQKTIPPAQWNETIKTKNMLGGPSTPTVNRNHHEATQDLLDENDREDTVPHEQDTLILLHT